jgi:uncharacterized protein (TIRG00374 family)
LPEDIPHPLPGAVVNRRLLIDIGKYVLAAGLLIWVVRANWSPPPPPRPVAALASSSVGLAGTTPGGPLLAASAAYPGRAQPGGLGQVWERHVTRHEPIHLGFLGAAFAIYIVALVLTLIRWHILVRALGLEITFRDSFRYGLVGVFFNTFLPGSVGGDIITAAVLARGQTRRTAAVATVVMDRAIALWALVWFVALIGGCCWLCGCLGGVAASTVVGVASIIAASTGIIWLLLGLLPQARADRFALRLTGLPFVGNAASEFWKAVWMYRQKQATVAGVMMLSWVGQVGFVLSFYCGIRALWSADLGAIPALAQHFLLVPIGLVMQALIPTPGGAGGGEWGFAALYLLFNAAEANGVLASLVQRVFSWLVGLVGYLVYLWAAKPAQAESSAETALPAPQARALAG